MDQRSGENRRRQPERRTALLDRRTVEDNVLYLLDPVKERRGEDRRGPENNVARFKGPAAERIERLALIKHSLLSTSYQNRAYRVGVDELLNRFFTLIQDHTVIAILDEQKELGAYRVIYHTMLDPLWQGAFEDVLLDAGSLQGDHIIWDKEHAETNSYKFHDTKRFAFYSIDFGSDKRERYGAPDFRLYNFQELEDSYIMDFLHDFQDEKEFLHHIYLSENINQKLGYRADCWQSGSFDIRRLKDGSEDTSKSITESHPVEDLIKFDKISDGMYQGLMETTPDWLDDSDTFIETQIGKIRDLVEEQYKQVCESPLLNKNRELSGIDSTAPNISFSARFFTAQTMRYRGKKGANLHYPFRTRTILPDTQRAHLKKAFATLKRENIDSERLFEGRDQFFWEHIQNGTIEDILNTIEEPEGETARALCDMVYCSGFVRVSHEPYATRGVDRLDEGVWEAAQNGALSDIPDDYKRLVYHHYMDYIFSPTGKSASVMMVPLRIGGATWGSLSFTFDPDEARKHETWLDLYRFYHAISTYMARELRRKLKALYLETIEHIHSWILQYLLKYGDDVDDESLSSYEELFNYCAKIISRLYPFKVVQLTKVESAAENYCEILNSVPYDIALSNNPYFLKTDFESFISEKDILQSIHKGDHRWLEANDKLQADMESSFRGRNDYE